MKFKQPELTFKLTALIHGLMIALTLPLSTLAWAYSPSTQQVAACTYVENSQLQNLKIFMKNKNKMALLATLSGTRLSVDAVEYSPDGSTLQIVAARHILISIPKGTHTQTGHIGVMLGSGPIAMNCSANW